MTKKRFWIVKNMNDELLAIFTNKKDFEEFIDYSCMEFMEIKI